MDLLSQLGLLFLVVVVPGIAIGSMIALLMLEKKVQSLEQTAHEHKQCIKTLQLRPVTFSSIPEPQLIEMMEEYRAYRNNGGGLDLLGYLLAQDEHLRFP